MSIRVLVAVLINAVIWISPALFGSESQEETPSPCPWDCEALTNLGLISEHSGPSWCWYHFDGGVHG